MGSGIEVNEDLKCWARIQFESTWSVKTVKLIENTSKYTELETWLKQLFELNENCFEVKVFLKSTQDAFVSFLYQLEI